MKIYDQSYDEIIAKLLSVYRDREEAKRIVGEIYKKALQMAQLGNYDSETIQSIFNKIRAQYGIS